MNTPVGSAKSEKIGTSAGDAPAKSPSTARCPLSNGRTPWETADRTPTIAELLTTRPESLSTLDEALAVLRSIQVFRAVLDDVADPLKAKIGAEGCLDEYFIHGLGVLAGLEEQDRQLAELERCVKAVRLGARRASAPQAQQQGEGLPNVETPPGQAVRLARPAPPRPPAGDASAGSADAEAPPTSPAGRGAAAA